MDPQQPTGINLTLPRELTEAIRHTQRSLDTFTHEVSRLGDKLQQVQAEAVQAAAVGGAWAGALTATVILLVLFYALFVIYFPKK